MFSDVYGIIFKLGITEPSDSHDVINDSLQSWCTLFGNQNELLIMTDSKQR